MTLQFKIITNREEAKVYWEMFSSQKTIDDEWDFRDIWTNELKYAFNFIVGFDGEKPIGLLPLQLNNGNGIGAKVFGTTEHFLEFFGGVDTDNNTIMVLPDYEHLSEQLLHHINTPTILAPLGKPYSVGENSSNHYIDQFELDLTRFEDFNHFMKDNFEGKSRQRLINRINKLQRKYNVKIIEGSHEDLLLLFNLSISRFGDDSSFNMEYRRNAFINLAKRYPNDIFIININGENKAISFSTMYKETYSTINIGYDLQVRDISKLLVITQIKRAIEKKCKVFDAGKGENGWKEHFNLTKIPQYKMELHINREKM